MQPLIDPKRGQLQETKRPVVFRLLAFLFFRTRLHKSCQAIRAFFSVRIAAKAEALDQRARSLPMSTESENILTRDRNRRSLFPLCQAMKTSIYPRGARTISTRGRARVEGCCSTPQDISAPVPTSPDMVRSTPLYSWNKREREELAQKAASAPLLRSVPLPSPTSTAPALCFAVPKVNSFSVPKASGFNSCKSLQWPVRERSFRRKEALSV